MFYFYHFRGFLEDISSFKRKKISIKLGMTLSYKSSRYVLLELVLESEVSSKTHETIDQSIYRMSFLFPKKCSLNQFISEVLFGGDYDGIIKSIWRSE